MQHYPPSALYVVATPIGNLADITLRALHVLHLADVIACEDTRHSQAMLRAYGIDKPAAQLLALHQHNEAELAQQVVQRLQAGQRIAYVSDAGTPAISDPGARLVAAVHAAGLRAIPLPGASSITTALSVAGVSGNAEQQSGFFFWGFLPSKPTERDSAVKALAQQPHTIILLEAPHRIEALAQSLACLGLRKVTLGRELTKQFEEIATVAAAELPHWLSAQPQRTRGEFVIIIHPEAMLTSDQDGLHVLQLLLAELPLKTAVKLAVEITGVTRNVLYDQALKIKKKPCDSPNT